MSSTAAPGTVVAIHSTVEADTPARLAEAAAAHGVHVIDAPVSGGAMEAAAGTLAVMVGGSDEAVAIAREPLGAFASLVAHLPDRWAPAPRPSWRGTSSPSSYGAVGEALRLAEAAGVDLALLGEVVRHSDRVTGGPGAVMLRNTAAALGADDGLRPIFEHTRGLGEKDLQLALELGRDLGVDLPFAALAHEHLGAALGVPHPLEDQR
ncbi:MAG: NAD(P)-binding domain-containing protein [Acidimicrobiales bacterium]